MTRSIVTTLLTAVCLLPTPAGAQQPAWARARSAGGITVRSSQPTRADRSTAPGRDHAFRPSLEPRADRAPSQQGGDLFRAGPSTYAPEYDQPAGSMHAARRLFRRPVLVLDPFIPSVVTRVAIVDPARAPVEPNRASRPARAPRLSGEPRESPETLDATSPVITVTAAPKTFYVVSGCYAGDRPPRTDLLPDRCRDLDLRVIPPLVRD